MPTAHCVSTTDGVIIAADRGFLDLVQRPESAVVGASYREITHPTDLARSARMIAALVDGGPPLRFHKRYLRPDGSEMAAKLLVTRFSGPDRLVTTLFWHEGARDLAPARLWEAALRIRHVHAVRRAEFGHDLASDPIGSLLVAIYLAEAEGRVIGVDRLAADAGLGASTTVRWIRVLEEQGLVRADGAADVQFTQAGIAKMERTLTSVFHLPGSWSGAA